MRAQFGIVDALAPARWWMIGFEHGPYEPMEFELDTRESGTPATVDLIGPAVPRTAVEQFAASLERLAAAAGPKVVTCVPARAMSTTSPWPSPASRRPVGAGHRRARHLQLRTPDHR
jgi:hypothetical protein